MSKRYRFELATAADDAQLCARMAEDRMEGNIAISFRREPSFFAGCSLQGERTTVIKCVDSQDDRIVGMGSRSTSTMYVDGRPERIGYLADLRAAPAHRRGTLLARGYRFLRELHEGDPVAFYVSVIYEGNKPAFDSLIGARAGLPRYRDAGCLLTPAIHFDFPRRQIRIPGVDIIRGRDELLPEIVAVLNAQQSRKQFAPVYRTGDFGNGRFTHLYARDFFLAVGGGKIVATLAAWDQTHFRQTHVERYSIPLRVLRPMYNLAARVSPLKPLPQPGARIPYVVLACLAVQNDDVALFRCLLRAAYNKLRCEPWHYAIAGLHERDPLARVLGEYRRIEAAGRLFTVHYPEAERRVASLEPRIPYLEAGCL
jgi:hypothetical protein